MNLQLFLMVQKSITSNNTPNILQQGGYNLESLSELEMKQIHEDFKFWKKIKLTILKFDVIDGIEGNSQKLKIDELQKLNILNNLRILKLYDSFDENKQKEVNVYLDNGIKEGYRLSKINSDILSMAKATSGLVNTMVFKPQEISNDEE